MNKQEKDEQKEFLGIPINWDSKNMFQNFWNKEDDELFPPKRFGIGWFPFYAIVHSKSYRVQNPSQDNFYRKY